MKSASKWMMVTAVGVSTLAFGCAKKTETATTDVAKTTPAVAEKEQPGTSAPSDISAATAKSRVADLKVGPQLDLDGSVATNTDEMKPGDPIYASITVADIGVGSAVEAIWMGPDDTRIFSEVKRVDTGATHLTFKAPDTASWKTGNYKVEIRLGDEVGGSEGFEIASAG